MARSSECRGESQGKGGGADLGSPPINPLTALGKGLMPKKWSRFRRGKQGQPVRQPLASPGALPQALSSEQPLSTTKVSPLPPSTVSMRIFFFKGTPSSGQGLLLVRHSGLECRLKRTVRGAGDQAWVGPVQGRNLICCTSSLATGTMFSG